MEFFKPMVVASAVGIVGFFLKNHAVMISNVIGMVRLTAAIRMRLVNKDFQ
jgi:hypothetical protein